MCQKPTASDLVPRHTLPSTGSTVFKVAPPIGSQRALNTVLWRVLRIWTTTNVILNRQSDPIGISAIEFHSFLFHLVVVSGVQEGYWSQQLRVLSCWFSLSIWSVAIWFSWHLWCLLYIHLGFLCLLSSHHATQCPFLSWIVFSQGFYHWLSSPPFLYTYSSDSAAWDPSQGKLQFRLSFRETQT